MLNPKTQRVLVHFLGSLGDTCVALPALRVVRQAYPSARISMLTNLPVSIKSSPAPAVLEGTGLVDDFIAYPAFTRNPLALFRLGWQLRRRQFQIAVNLVERGDNAQATRRDRLFFQLCGIGRQIGYSEEQVYRRPVDSAGGSEHEAERFLRKVGELGQANLLERRWFDLNLTSAERQRADAILQQAGMPPSFLALSIGTKVSVNDWEQERWVRLVAALSREFPERGCIVVGAKDEIGRADECCDGWQGPKLNLCGMVAPRVSAALLARAAVFIGHDSGPMHLAAAVGTPCVAIFSGRNLPGKWFPLGDGHEVHYRWVECAGCGLDECTVEKKRCIRSISVEEVAAAVRRQIHRMDQAPPTGRTFHRGPPKAPPLEFR